MKHFAKQLITSLDDGDEAAVVTFGREAEIFFPLTKITMESRVRVSVILEIGYIIQKKTNNNVLSICLEILRVDKILTW